MRISIENIDSEFRKISQQVEKESKAYLDIKSEELLKDLKEATPVDTGRARDGWELVKGVDVNKIENDVPYIDRLNHGSSKQAPPFFVEKEALKYGRPLGTIVNTKS